MDHRHVAAPRGVGDLFVHPSPRLIPPRSRKRNVKRMSIPAEDAWGPGQCMPQQPEHSDKENRDAHTNDEDQGLESAPERWQFCDELFGVDRPRPNGAVAKSLKPSPSYGSKSRRLSGQVADPDS